MRQNPLLTLLLAPQSRTKGIIKDIWAYLKRKLSIDLDKTRDNTISEVKEVLKDIFLEYILKLIAPRNVQKAIRANEDYISILFKLSCICMKTFDF